MIQRAKVFVEQVYWPDLVAIAGFYKDWAAIGGGVKNHLAVGEFPSAGVNDLDQLYFPRGIILNNDLSTVHPYDHKLVKEYITSSWYQYSKGDGTGLHPWEGETKTALCIARGLADGGRLLCCDVSEEWTAIGREAWKRAGVDDRIDLEIAPAIETLRGLPADEPIDLAFVDADKGGYVSYYQELLPRLRTNGVILVDNTLWSGAVVDEARTDDDTKAIREFNDMVAADARVESTILTIGDGLTLIRKR
jgi:hypothetical protein